MSELNERDERRRRRDAALVRAEYDKSPESGAAGDGVVEESVRESDPVSMGGLPAIPSDEVHAPQESRGRFKKLIGPFAAIIFLLVKFKGVLLALTKVKFLAPLIKFFPTMLKTGGTMIFAIVIYSMFFGVWFAVGLVLLILVHEYGHLIAARRCGLKVGVPVFIPFMGAVIALKEAPKNAWIEAQVAIGGPLAGTAAAIFCAAVYAVTDSELFLALAYFGFFLNLFNLAPMSPLDGGRVVTVISPWLWVAGLVLILAMIVASKNIILFLILLLGLPRVFTLFRKRTDEEQRFYEVSRRQRIEMSVVYFGLALFLWLGMQVSHELLTPIREGMGYE